jgi:hypothetical protein
MHANMLWIIHNQRETNQILSTKEKNVFQNVRFNYHALLLVVVLALIKKTLENFTNLHYMFLFSGNFGSHLTPINIMVMWTRSNIM